MWDPPPLYAAAVRDVNARLRRSQRGEMLNGGPGEPRPAGLPRSSSTQADSRPALKLTESNIGKLQFVSGRQRSMTMDSMRKELAASIVDRMRKHAVAGLGATYDEYNSDEETSLTFPAEDGCDTSSLCAGRAARLAVATRAAGMRSHASSRTTWHRFALLVLGCMTP